MVSVRLISVFILSSVLGACANNSLRIGNSVNVCCPGDYENYKSFGIVTEEIPYFLQDYVVKEFSATLSEKGLQRNDQINDLRITLRYRHVNLDAEQQSIDPFIRNDSFNVELHYIAAIDIDMKETATNKLVWSGEIHRIHNVSPGEYMHEDRAALAFRETFRDLLSHYPSAVATE